MKAWRLSVVVLALVLLLGTALPALAQGGPPIKPGGPFVPPNANNNGSALMTFADVEKELFALQERSKGAIKLDVAGTTLEGRPLYIVKMGQGPQRMWIQGRIHGTCVIGAHTWIGPQSYFDARDLILEEYVGWGPGAKVLGSSHTGEPADVPIIQTDLEFEPVRTKARMTPL